MDPACAPIQDDVLFLPPHAESSDVNTIKLVWKDLSQLFFQNQTLVKEVWLDHLILIPKTELVY